MCDFIKLVLSLIDYELVNIYYLCVVAKMLSNGMLSVDELLINIHYE